jgi:threonine dehydrogenase-like Zn-dependent dehydrogenase
LKTKTFYTDGKKNILEETWDKPEPKDNEIEVKSIYTGVCRSDLDMHCGLFQLLPKTMQGHEGLGVVTKVGKSARFVKEGDFVATRGEPAFSDYYNCPEMMYVPVSEAHPKYILEPVACGLNIASSLYPLPTNDPILLLGSGFLATIVATSLMKNGINDIYVVGNANKEFWKKQDRVNLVDTTALAGMKFKYIIDLSDKPEYLNLNVYAERAIIVLAAEKHPEAQISFSQFLWNAVTIKFPSPRNESFFESMCVANLMVKRGEIQTADLWTKSYDRETEVELAFSEGLARPVGYSRGYIEWQR